MKHHIPIPVVLLAAGTVLALAAAPRALAAATAVNFAGTITATGPGSLTVFGPVTTAFNTVSGFGLAAMAGGDRPVMSFSAASDDNAGGLLFTHATPSPNTTGYSLFMDVYFSAIPNYLSLAQLDTPWDNSNDGDLFARSSGAIGINSDYSGTAFTAGAWHRVGVTVDNSLTTSFLSIYIDGVLANTVDAWAASPGRFDLSDPSILLFGDEDNETGAGYISQFYFSDRVLGAGEVAALGGASASPIPEPSGSLLALAAGGLTVLRRRRSRRR